MSISFGSIQTGLPKDIVKQLVEAEKIPLRKMESRKQKFGEKKALVEQLMGLVEGLQGTILQNGNARSLRELSFKGNDSIVGVELDKNTANPGSYQIEVMQLAQKSSAMSSGFEDPDDSYVGVGFIQFTLPDGTSKDVYVDSDNASLNGIARLINKDTENGMSANVINDGSGTDRPHRLIISLDKTGDEQLAEFPYLYFVDGEDDFYLEFEREAQDAKVKLDGFEIELPSNRTADLIKGATLDFKKAAPGEEFTLEITEDIGKIAEKIQTLIDGINEVFKFIKEQNTLDQNSDTSRTLGGDITLQSLEGRLRAAIFKDVQTDKGFMRLSNLGIRFQKSGLLQFDPDKFKNEVGKDYNLVSQILTGRFDDNGLKTDGLIDNLRSVTDLALQRPNGLLQSRKKTFQTNMDQIDKRIENKQRLISQKEKSLKDRFARLEGTISRLKAQGQGVAAISGGGGSVIPQLG
ncbi:MAG: flagellar filament capping protein FliD [Bacteriovoracaceae bacterium]